MAEDKTTVDDLLNEVLSMVKDTTRTLKAQNEAQDAAVTAAKSLGAMRQALLNEGFNSDEAFDIIMVAVKQSASTPLVGSMNINN